ncbi:dihydrofolate reductase [Turicibacter sanguinis]|nr:dihydrofolate reductase [Turicibacter sanguinis]MTN84903.1 dihydrofolate reductase [Turicibacter sanguinis]MTN87725.1 dihydrofolate reductase [Turicibacter sanguinis]MTN90547.1 dihydrofolate reductase [Turicibacter sanguinis]MTN93469.1 dihydrofolate reductase [Turicibacter sanguinis]
MSGKIVLNLAISLDGYIADENGGFEWIVGDGNSALNTDLKWDYKKFLEEIDIVVMGKNCYNQGFHKDFKDKPIYVATSQDITDYDYYHFLKADIIDEYIIGIIPTILGKGRPLFLGNNPKIDLSLQYYTVEDGIVIMKYSKREK